MSRHRGTAQPSPSPSPTNEAGPAHSLIAVVIRVCQLLTSSADLQEQQITAHIAPHSPEGPPGKCQPEGRVGAWPCSPVDTDPSEGFPGSSGSSGSIAQHPQLTRSNNPGAAAPSLGVIRVGDLSWQARLTPTGFSSHFPLLSFSALIDFRVLNVPSPDPGGQVWIHLDRRLGMRWDAAAAIPTSLGCSLGSRSRRFPVLAVTDQGTTV